MGKNLTFSVSKNMSWLNLTSLVKEYIDKREHCFLLQ